MGSKKNYLFLIGAPKCGTTSLAATLSRHPQIDMPLHKETLLFTDFAERTWTGPGVARFQALTSDFDAELAGMYPDTDAPWRIEASTDNLSCPVSARRIAEFAKRDDVGEIRVVAILRDPVLRAVSEYQHTVRDGLETKSLRKSLLLEQDRLAQGMNPLFGHVFRSRYASQLARYFDLFGDDLLILDYHRLNQGRAVVYQVTEAMGLAPVEIEEVPARNRSFVYRSPVLARLQANETVLQVLRMLVPKGLRSGIRSLVARLNRTRYRPGKSDLDMLRSALQDDIAACVADPRIPTRNWTAALDR